MAYSISFQDLKNQFNIYPNFELDSYIKSTVFIHYGKYDYHKYKNDASNTSIINCTNFNLDELEISNYAKNELINEAFCIDLNNSIMNISENSGYSTLEISIYLNKTYFNDYVTIYNISEKEINEIDDILNNYNFHLNMYLQTINSPSEFIKVANIKRIKK